MSHGKSGKSFFPPEYESMKVDAIGSRTIPKAVQFHIVSVMDYLSLNFYSSCKHMSYKKLFFS